jgi:superoxide reductase
MAKQDALYVCEICNQIVEVKKAGAGTLVCCNQPMKLFVEE